MKNGKIMDFFDKNVFIFLILSSIILNDREKRPPNIIIDGLFFLLFYAKKVLFIKLTWRLNYETK